jgi:hypothetical protein
MNETHERLHLVEILKMAKNDISLILQFTSLYIADFQEIKSTITSVLLEKNIDEFRSLCHRYLPALKIIQAKSLIQKLDECKLGLDNTDSTTVHLNNLSVQMHEICEANLLELLAFQAEQIEKRDAKAKL